MSTHMVLTDCPFAPPLTRPKQSMDANEHHCERRDGRLTIPFAHAHTQDFMMLDEVLRSKFWYTAVPKLPGKKMFFNLDDDFIKKRKKELETYLKEVLQVACFSQSDELWQFFTDSRSIVGVPPELEEENARHAQVLPEQEPEE